MKNTNFTGICFISLIIVGLFPATSATAEGAGNKEQEIFYIYPDGVMEFRGRIMNREDVVIYEDGRGGELAAVKLSVPRKPDFYRSNIIVVRKEIDVSVAWDKEFRGLFLLPGDISRQQ